LSELKIPNIVIVYEFKSKVPFVNVTVTDAALPTLRASCNCQAPPTPSNIVGYNNICPFEVIVFVPLVDANVRLPVDAVNDTLI